MSPSGNQRDSEKALQGFVIYLLYPICTIMIYGWTMLCKGRSRLEIPPHVQECQQL